MAERRYQYGVAFTGERGLEGVVWEDESADITEARETAFKIHDARDAAGMSTEDMRIVRRQLWEDVDYVY